jgi:hypothetical protein
MPHPRNRQHFLPFSPLTTRLTDTETLNLFLGGNLEEDT